MIHGCRVPCLAAEGADVSRHSPKNRDDNKMKYFTRGMVRGELEDDEVDEIRRAYEQRLESISHQLTEPLRLLAKLSLQDAIIESSIWVPAMKCLSMSLVAPYLNGYQVVRLKYLGALLGTGRVRTLSSVARDRETQILASEVDWSDGGTFSHRLLFWPSDELTIYFSGLEIDLESREDDRVHLVGFFREIYPEES